MIDILIIVVGYLLGGISTGYYLVRFINHDDVRKYGSGATGATNVGRMLGAKGFLLTSLGDGLKGSLIPLLAIFLERSDLTVFLGLIAVVIGHVWPLQLGFRGGKGVATAFGGIVVIDPQLALVLFAITMGLWTITRKFALSGLIVILGAPIIAFYMSGSIIEMIEMIEILSLTMVLLIAHKENILKMLGKATPRRD